MRYPMRKVFEEKTYGTEKMNPNAPKKTKQISIFSLLYLAFDHFFAAASASSLALALLFLTPTYFASLLANRNFLKALSSFSSSVIARSWIDLSTGTMGNR